MAQTPADAEHACFARRVRAIVQDIPEGMHEGFRPALCADRNAIMQVSGFLLYVIANYDGPQHNESKMVVRAFLDMLVDRMSSLLEQSKGTPSHIRPEPIDYSGLPATIEHPDIKVFIRDILSHGNIFLRPVNTSRLAINSISLVLEHHCGLVKLKWRR